MHRALIPALVLLAHPAVAQTCTEPTGPINTCVVGAWVGTSTIPDALQQMVQSLPAPIGTITYDLIRVPSDAFPFAMRAGADGTQ